MIANRPDWPRIIAEIEASGITLYKLSLMLPKQLHLLKRWKDGAEPKHSEGERLLAIHAGVSKSTHRVVTK